MSDSGIGLGAAARWAEGPPTDVAVVLGNLLQAYALFTDEARIDELAELFTADAEWNGDDLGYGAARGPVEIAQLVTSHYRTDAPMIHLPGPPLFVAVSDDEVDAVSWCFATRWSDGVTAPLILFHYEDSLRREGGRWRFARRVLRRRLPPAEH